MRLIGWLIRSILSFIFQYKADRGEGKVGYSIVSQL